MTKNSLVRLFAVLALTAAACSGDDGATGATGPQGPAGQDGAQGPAGADAPTTVAAQIETCAVCHDSGSIADFSAAHALPDVITVSEQAATVDGTAAVITFKIEVNGAPSDAFDLLATYSTRAPAGWTSSYYYEYNATTGLGVRTALSFAEAAPGTPAGKASALSLLNLTSLGGGRYEVRIPDGAPTAGAARRYMLRLDRGAGTQATVVADVLDASGKPTYLAADDQACVNCHGNNVFFKDGEHHGANPQGVGACVVCHVTNTASRGQAGDRLKAYVHGIHNSHNMPDGVYNRSATSTFSIGFPGYMNNCSTCHEANLTKVLAAPVTFSTCMSCHDDWDGFSKTKAAEPALPLSFHRSMAATTNCSACHDGAMAFATVAGVHGKRQAYTPRNGLLYDGKDQSIEKGKEIEMAITGAAIAGGEMSITWTAVNPLAGDAAYNPCNTDVATGPVFFGATANAATGQAASNMSVLRAFALGNDWVNDGQGTSPGQPAGAVNVTAANTTCDGNVATTKVPALTTSATKGVVALQGKPQVTFTSGSYSRVIQTRAKSPTREFAVADGALPTDVRRTIVDIDKCNKCHLGSMYQHGGNRVDAIELCVMCHNPASNDTYRTTVGVDASKAYDGKAGETYDMRYMIHAIHSAGATDAPYVLYRSNGIYAFGSAAAIAGLPNWPGAGTFDIYGSNPVTPKNHNEIVVHYPRALNDCGACHVGGSENVLPSQTQQMAVTVAAGAAPWSNQADDALLGATTASCMSCHQSGVSGEQAMLRGHAYQNGWTPAVVKGGRQGLIDAAK